MQLDRKSLFKVKDDQYQFCGEVVQRIEIDTLNEEGRQKVHSHIISQ